MSRFRIPLPCSFQAVSPWRAVAWSFCSLMYFMAFPAATGQTPDPTPGRSYSLAAYAPGETRLFIEINGITANPESDRSRNARKLAELLLGDAQDRKEVAEWRKTFLRGFGLDADEGFGSLFARHLAVAAPSWSRLSEGVVLVRLEPEDELLQKTFAPGDDEATEEDNVRVYRTRTQLFAATDRDVLVISQKDGAKSLYRRVVQHLCTGAGDVLAEDPEFLAETKGLSAKRDGTVYLELSPDREAEPSGLQRWIRWPVTRLAVGVRFEQDHVSFAFHARHPEAPVEEADGRPPMSRLLRLPLTTLVAWSTEFDVPAVFRALIDQGSASAAPSYVERCLQILDSDKYEESIINNLGPGAIITWDQYLGPGTEIPQIAIILESGDSLKCANAVAEVIQAVVTFFDIANRGRPGPRLRLARTDYLGTAIYEVRLPFRMTGRGDAWRLQPAFAAVGESFVVALSAEQIRNLIDAEMGLAPTLTSLRDLVRRRRDDRSTVMLGLAQPALIAQTLDQWLSTPDGMMAKWVAETLGGSVAEAAKPPMPKLGIGMRPGERPGTVEVVHVDQEGRSAGRIFAGDQILGVNGALLSLEFPTADLRKLVIDEAASGRWMFRIDRNGRFLDVAVPCPGLTRASDPRQALRRLKHVLEHIDFGSLRAVAFEPGRVRANLTLRFAASESRG
jgi:hypothetical protein